MAGSFPLLMTLVLMLAVWAERLLDKSDELVPIEDKFDSKLETLSPKAGVAVPASRSAFVTEPEL